MVKTTKKTYYKAFGLAIQSEMLLPELPNIHVKESTVNVNVEFSDLTKLWEDIGVPGKFVVQDQSVLFKIENTAIFCIHKGERVIVSPIIGADEDKIRLYILGSCMGIILMQRNTLPLHGSAIAIGDKVYAFIGDSGAGKSTLASAFLKKGYKILSDDVIAVSLSENNEPIVYPAYPQQKLWENSLNKFGMDSNDYLPLFERETKFSVPVASHFHHEPLPLAGIFELKKTGEADIDIAPVNRLERLQILYQHTYRNFLIPRLGLMDWHFHTITKFANQIAVFRLGRPETKFTAHQLTSLILDTIHKGELIHDYQ
jgi:hypothetical protein